MRYSLKDLAWGLIKTSFILIFMEIITTTIIPSLGLQDLKITFSVLIILYFAFKLDTPFLPLMIFFIQYIHSAFAVEGWAINTFMGIIVVLSFKYIKDLMSFHSAFSTIVVVSIFQFIWFVGVSFLLCLKMGQFEIYFSFLKSFFPQIVFMSLLAPLTFKMMDYLWKHLPKERGVGI
jgi:hypothetical protein